jgi:1-acyl-sn-glycerol-3-phosphate acyltransferase
MVGKPSSQIVGAWVVAAWLMPLTAFTFGVMLRQIPYPESGESPFAVVAGVIVGLLYWHRYRGLGFALFASFGALCSTLFAASIGEWHSHTVAIASFCFGLLFIRAGLFLSFWLKGTEHFAWSILFLAACAVALYAGNQLPAQSFVFLPVLAGILTAISALRLFRPAFELAVEPILWIMYHIRAAGPVALPARGPCIVIANHACWLDPHFLAKVLPRPITPMMTSRFYDIPWLQPLLKLFHTIRVPEQRFKRQETPDEIRDAIAALDRGDCLVLFPEGLMRRTEDKPLKRFGRGVWQVLTARPNTPVYCCWIEGGWGSFTSYFNGKPTKNKRPDFRRYIGVVVPEPITVDADTLSHHLTTRLFLMNRVLESRKMLGLPDLPPFELPKDDDE